MPGNSREPLPRLPLPSPWQCQRFLPGEISSTAGVRMARGQDEVVEQVAAVRAKPVPSPRYPSWSSEPRKEEVGQGLALCPFDRTQSG